MPMIQGGWQRKAACRALSPDDADRTFFVGQGGRSTEARSFCTESGCPVKRSCYYYAVLYDEEGFWAGTSKKERDGAPPELKKALFEEAVYYNVLETRDYDAMIRAAIPALKSEVRVTEVETQESVEPTTHGFREKLAALLNRSDNLVTDVRALLATS